MVALRAPFTGEPTEVVKTEERFAGIQFGKDFALVEDQARISRLLRTFEIDERIRRAAEADLEPQFAGSL